MLYDAMFKRKAIRKYTKESLDSEILKELETYISNLDTLFPDIKTELKIINREDAKKSSVKSPHYIAAFSEEKEGYLINIGFMLEQLDLFLSSKNIGACWVGMGNPSKEIKEKSNLKFVILLAFGNTKEVVHREDLSEFNRKTIEEVSNLDNELAQTVRLAPSAMNTQPWYYFQKYNEIDIYIARNSVIKNLVMGKFNRIDMGISMCFLWVLMKNNNCKLSFKIYDDRFVENYEYMITAVINENFKIGDDENVGTQ